jgi:hypothetical protein
LVAGSLASERSKIGIESKDILITRDRHRDLTERKAKERKEEGRKEGKKEEKRSISVPVHAFGSDPIAADCAIGNAPHSTSLPHSTPSLHHPTFNRLILKYARDEGGGLVYQLI